MKIRVIKTGKIIDISNIIYTILGIIGFIGLFLVYSAACTEEIKGASEITNKILFGGILAIISPMIYALLENGRK